ncbi:MAG TPA: hypothetical protein VFE41_27490 [Acetobacteraceae bacterium]|jgi:hypothetical protein|nr:hypothetical protein [Acetobacteraceae bacterium]
MPKVIVAVAAIAPLNARAEQVQGHQRGRAGTPLDNQKQRQRQ